MTPTQDNTIRGAMVYLRDQVLNKPRDIVRNADLLSPMPLSAVSSVSRHAQPVGSIKRKNRKKHRRAGKGKQPTPPGTPTGGKTGEGVPRTTHGHQQEPNDGKKTTGAPPLPNGTLPLSPRPDVDDVASSTPRSDATDVKGAAEFLQGTPPGTPPRVDEPTGAAAPVRGHQRRGLPKDRGLLKDMVAKMNEKKFEGAPQGWPDQITFNDFQSGEYPAIQAAFVKLVEDPASEELDAVAVRRLLYAWFDAGYSIYRDKKIDENEYELFILARGLLNKPDSEDVYMKYHAFRYWFDKLSGDDKLLRNSILDHFKVPIL
jgi:hypothetical protein